MTDSLTQLAIQLTRAILPVIIIAGVIGNSLNIAVLTRPALNNRACSLYFLAVATNDLFYSSVMFVYHLLADGFQLDVALTSLILCKIIQYMNTICPLLSPYFVVLASVDRYCASSRIAKRRSFSSVRVARWAILIVIAIFALFFIITLVTTEIRQDDGLGCAIRGDTVFKQVYAFIQVILFAIMAPCLMVIFGLMTIYNANRLGIMPARVSRYDRTERQLARMLFLQVGTNIVLNLPLSIIYLMLSLPSAFQPTSTFYFIYRISELPYYFSYTTAFALYVCSARVYRRELIQLMYKAFRLRRGNQVHSISNSNTVLPMVSTIHTLTAVRD